MTNAKSIFSLIALGAALIAAPAMAQDSGKPGKAPAPAATQPTAPAAKPTDTKDTKKDEAKKDQSKTELAIGKKAPEFTLKDTEGKEYTLSQATAEGNIVVLVWFNPGCPFVQKHLKEPTTFSTLAKHFEGKKVKTFLINSGAPGTEGSGVERNAKAKKDAAIAFPILLDDTGVTGQAYNAHNTPVTYVIDAKGNLAYQGALDDDAGSEKPGKTNYAIKAVDELLAGKEVATKTTKPYGCAVKYGNKK